MDAREQALATDIYAAIQTAANHTDRGEQARSFRAGVSDLGYCSERLRRMLDRQVPDETDMLLAWIGTALGDALEDAVVAAFPGAIKQAETTTTLLGDTRTYDVLGHPDLILPEEGILLDGKTSYGLALARRLGADRQKQFQRHCYAAGAHDAGLFGDRPLSEVMVGNVWLDRSGVQRGVHVDLEPFNDAVLHEAAMWLDEVVNAFIEGRPAEKEPAREVCETTCGFFKDCRAFDTDVTGLLTDPEHLAAVDLYLEGKQLSKTGKAHQEEAKSVLRMVGGSTGTHTVRWVHVNGTEQRAGYERLDIREVR